MKKYLILFVLFAHVVSAQETYTDLIEYQVGIKVSGHHLGSEKFFLLMNSEESFGFTYRSKENYSNVFNTFDIRKSVPRVQYNNENDYFIYSIGIKDFWFFKDEPPMINWEILKDKKEILGFTCQKAIGKFRGRTYIVWFTTDIPYTYGPWKLKGLPGVILESTDKKELFTYRAVNISLNKTVHLPKEIEDKWIFENEIKPYTFYVKWSDNKLKKMHEKSIALYPKGTQIIDSPLRELEPETEFEWETKK